MKNNNGFIHSVIRYRRIIFFLVSILVVFGIWGLLNINKDEFPTFEIKDGLVAGVYPGATAKEVEEQLTRPLEELIFKFPEVKRDLALLIDESVSYSAIRKAALAAEKRLLKSVVLFDVYRGDKIPAGKKQYAISFVLQDSEKTLTDQYVENTMSKILSAITKETGAALR